MTTGHALGHRAAQVALKVGVLRALDMPFGVTAQAVVRVFQGKAAIQDHPPARLLALGQLLGLISWASGMTDSCEYKGERSYFTSSSA